MTTENPLLGICHKFLDSLEIKEDLVEGLIKDGQIYLNFLDSITKIGYSYSTRGSYSIGPEKLDDLPEGYQVKVHFDPISGLPYATSKCVKMQCKYGKNYYGPKKLDDPGKKKKNYVSKKIGCPSTLNIKMRHMFLNKRYRNAVNKSAYGRRKVALDLHERMKSTDNKPLSKIWYHISLTLSHSHPPASVEELDTEDGFEADNSNMVFHEVEVQTTPTVPELTATLRELLMDTIGLTYNLPEDEESVENVKYLVFRASSLKSTIEAFLNPDEAKKPRYQSFAKRKKIKKTVETLQKEARIRDDKWGIPSGKKRKVKGYRPLTKQSTDKIGLMEKSTEKSLEDSLSLLEIEMLEESKKAEKALKENISEPKPQLLDLEEPLVEENMFLDEERFMIESIYSGKEAFIEEDMYHGEKAIEGEETYTGELTEEEPLLEQDLHVDEEHFTEEERIMKEGEETPEEELLEEKQPSPKKVKVLKVSSVLGGYLNIEIVSVKASELGSTQYTNR